MTEGQGIGGSDANFDSDVSRLLAEQDAKLLSVSDLATLAKMESLTREIASQVAYLEALQNGTVIGGAAKRRHRKRTAMAYSVSVGKVRVAGKANGIAPEASA